MNSKSESVNHNSAVSSSVRKDRTKGSILFNLVDLSWPMAVTQSLMTLGPTIDMIWVSRLGTAALAGVGVSGVIVMLAQSLMMGLNMGMRALVARAIGATAKGRLGFPDTPTPRSQAPAFCNRAIPAQDCARW